MGSKRRKKAKIFKKSKGKQAAKREARRNALVEGMQRGWDTLAGFMKRNRDQFLKSCNRCQRLWQARHRRNVDIAKDPGEGCSHWPGQIKLPEKEMTRKKARKTNIERHWDRLAGFLKKKKNQIVTAVSRRQPDIPTVQKTPDESITMPTNHHSTIPLTVETFTFHSLLGTGGFGKVMLATDAISKERVAVKIIKKRELIKASKTRGKLKNEDILSECRVLQLARECKFLTNGNAVLHTTSYLYCVMELGGGGDLFRFMKENVTLNLPTIKFIAAELVCGMQFMHSRGIIHRDLKLMNVLLTTDGHVKITDFGLALLNAYGETKSRTLVGTPGYMAPEIITRRSYSAAGDWFAFGVMLYKLILQKHPFPGNAAVKRRKILQEEPTYSGLTDPVTKDFLSKLLCKYRSARLGEKGKVREHRFFYSVIWENIETGKTASPVKPHRCSNDTDEKQQIPVSYSEAFKEPIPATDQSLFEDIQFVCPKWGETYHNVPMEPDTISSVDGNLHNQK
ncbi:protein kinase C delta type-like [Pseudophryne corroboree]|uniref:protein kinase C delta type-like n=1 Tax=Pseudophryne corroboree TaxID=495146 RepID=UPI003081AC74